MADFKKSRDFRRRIPKSLNYEDGHAYIQLEIFGAESFWQFSRLAALDNLD